MAPENTGSTPPRTINNTSQPEVQLSAICPNNLSLVPQQSVVPRWLAAEQTNASMATSQQAQRKVPKTKAGSKACSPYSSVHFEQLLTNRQKRRHQAQAVSPKLDTFPSGGGKPSAGEPSDLLQLMERCLSTPSGQNMPANEDPLSIKQTPQSVTDELQVSSSADKKCQEAKQHHASGPSVKNEADASAAPSGFLSRPDVAGLERRIKYIETRVYEVAHQLSRGTDEHQQRELQRKYFELEKMLREKQQLLSHYRIRYPTAPMSKEDRADQRPNRDQLKETWSGGQSGSPRDYPVTTSLMAAAREEEEAASYERALRPADRPSAPVLEAPREPAAPESPEDEWMEIKLEDSEQPLGHEEWEDDIVPELIPRGAANNPFYPGAMI